MALRRSWKNGAGISTRVSCVVISGRHFVKKRLPGRIVEQIAPTLDAFVEAAVGPHRGDWLSGLISLT